MMHPTDVEGSGSLPGAGDSRRAALRRGLRLAAGVASMSALAAAARAAPIAADEASATARTTSSAPGSTPAPSVAFLSRAQGIAALTQGEGIAYYDSLDLQEIRARMNSPLDGVTLAQARIAVRDYEAAAVETFTDDECTAVRGVIERMQLLLAVRAPLYARTPWSFVKLANRAEGSMPHTRGAHIVLPVAAAEAYAKMHRDLSAAGTLATSLRGRNLLVHEQTHVLERADPARFEPLFTQVFGFVRMTPPPMTPWLAARVVQNPDGPDLAWAFPLEKIGGTGWVMPCVTLADVAAPRMPQDFQAIAVDVARTGAGWKIIERNGAPKIRDLARLPGYDAHFPFADEDFHPNEIAAVLLSHWILQDVPGVNGRPLVAAAAEWARTALA
jgi:hypothetical protein